MSNRLAPTAISSMPQQAVANGIGQRLFLRHQFTTASARVRIVFSGISIVGELGRTGGAPVGRCATACGDVEWEPGGALAGDVGFSAM
jgi:hypothetical protein